MITTDQFFAQARRLQGQDIPTIGRNSTFRVSVDGDRLEYTLGSNGNKRIQYRSRVDLIVAHFNKTKSLVTTEYQPITQASSYALAIIRSLL